MENIILVGHGSLKKDANNIELTGKLLHNMMHPGCTKSCVKVAYMQFAHPDIAETIEACVQEGAERIIIHPFFLSSGMHVTQDIPEIVEEARKTYPDREFIFTEPLGVHEKLAQVVLERIDAAKGMTPQGIEKKSFELISQEIDLSDVLPEQLPIIKRVIHATADLEFKHSLVFQHDAIRVGLEAIRSGKDILTDVEMVRTGISKKLLEKWGGQVICRIPGADEKMGVDGGQGHETITRAETGIERALKERNNIGIIAVGNAPTALLKVIELFNAGAVAEPKPLVIGVPVGFVKAVESKALLAAQSFPFITNMSRKGGTPVAVAIVNALLKMAGEV
jgi:precorrin-8X/cobalt-precorrin-8 methylmutase